MTINVVTATMLSGGRVQINSGERSFVVDQRVKVERDGFCPIELVAAALAG